jgi:diacylglycerol kinase family enzyme
LIVIWDGDPQTVHVVHLSVGNAPVFGGVLNMRAPGASMTDSKLDVLLVERLSLTRVIMAATGTLFGQHRPVRRVQAMRAQSVTVYAEGDHEIAIDGEVGAHLPVEFTALSGALRVVAPARR